MEWNAAEKNQMNKQFPFIVIVASHIDIDYDDKIFHMMYTLSL